MHSSFAQVEFAEETMFVPFFAGGIRRGDNVRSLFTQLPADGKRVISLSGLRILSEQEDNDMTLVL